MKGRNENRPGHKKTKVGWIPEEWETAHLGNAADVLFSNVDKKTKSDENDVLLCNYTDVYYKKYITSDIDFMQATASNREIQKYRLRHGDVIITKDSETQDDIAVSAIVREEVPNLICGYHLAIIRSKDNRLSSEYLNKLFDAQTIRHYFATLANGVTRFGLTSNAVNNALIPLPPLHEQKKIAEILSTWDEAIEQTRKLIDAKKHRKKALMQQLLTGKKRLPGFRKSWKEYHLRELFHERRETNCEYLPLLAITGKNGIIPASDIERKDSSSTDKSRYKRIAPGDIGYNTMRMWQGVSAVTRSEGIVSPAYTICIPNNDVDVDFMGYLFKLSNIIHLFWRFSQGLVNDTLNLKFHNFSKIRIKIPPEDEQHRIAEVLATADNEIKALEQKLSSLEKQKRGMMQKLLTGEIRVNARGHYGINN